MGSERERADRAFNAMKALGISPSTVKPVLKNLLKVYDKDWGHIEAENYRVLVDAIFDTQESKEQVPPTRKKGASVTDDAEPYRKKQRSQQKERCTSASMSNSEMHGETSLEKLKAEDVSPRTHHGLRTSEPIPPRMNLIDKSNESESPQPSYTEKRTAVSPQPPAICKRPGPVSPQVNPGETRALIRANQTSPITENAEFSSLSTYRRDKRPVLERMDNLICYKEPKIEPGMEVISIDEAANNHLALINPSADSCGSELPTTLAMRHTPHPTYVKHKAEDGKKRNGKESVLDATCKKQSATELANVQYAASTNVEIASSTSREVKLSFTSSLDLADFHMPSIEAVCKIVEDKCLSSYKILKPNFSLMNILKEICQCALELGSKSANKQENVVKIVPAFESLKNSRMRDILGGTPACFPNVPSNLTVSRFPELTPMNGLFPCPNQNACGNNENRENQKKKELGGPETSNSDSRSLVVVQQPAFALGELRPRHDVNDVTKGEERVRIPLVNEVSSEQLPPSFHYIPHNIVYQNAYITFSLARIGDEDCCSDCFGDCLAASIPCACARETGGEYAYTLDGLMRKEFLDDCIFMNRDPQKNRLFYCKDCPLERSKNEVKPESCKGHLVRKFVKECWSKCGCNKQCGNRVVQRGITCNMQVFFTEEGKGWGLRPIDELPRGAFVCEYVGEVLTNMELYDRTILTTGNAKHTYPVLLDADWGSEGVLKDEEALCLDATFYGNVARFINHRCYDANLIEIPVEVETPDHHYYHLAFFTTRKIEAFEELTWDYGIDFDDHNHPIKAFRCRCGSKFCRDSRRKTKTRSGASLVSR